MRGAVAPRKQCCLPSPPPPSHASLSRRYMLANEIGRLYVMLAGHGVPDPAAAAGDDSSLFCCHDYDSENSYETSFPLIEARASS